MKTHSLSSGALRRGVALFLLLSWSAVGQAGPTPPDRMTYQGYLVDANGTALAPNSPANYPVIFRIYDASTGGTLLWTEQQIVTVDKGNFSVVLGEGTQYNSETRDALSSVFVGGGASDRYLGISVTIGSTTTEIAPRLRLLPSPYAFLAKSANTLVGADGTTLVTTASGGTLNTAGNLSATGNLSAGGNVSATGNLTGAALTVTGTAKATTLEGFGVVPIGGIILWSGAIANIPAGWVLCDGTSYGSLTAPNLKDRFVLGAGSSTNYVGRTSGSWTRTLSMSNIPSHTHSYTDSYMKSWTSIGWGTAAAFNIYTPDTTASTTGAAGQASPTAFEIVPPYYALAYIMRIQ